MPVEESAHPVIRDSASYVIVCVFSWIIFPAQSYADVLDAHPPDPIAQ